MATKPKSPTKPYGPYVFRNGHDPIMDVTVGAMGTQKKSDVSEKSGVSTSTISNWRNHKTKRPQFATTVSVLLSCGVKGIEFGPGGKPRLIFKE